jgi:hypothetical protein
LTEDEIIKAHVEEYPKFKLNPDPEADNLPILYWIPKLHKKPYKARFIANSKSCSTKRLSVILTSCLTEIKAHWQRYSLKTYEQSGINYFWSIKNSNEFLSKLDKKQHYVNSISTYDFSTLYTTLPHGLIKTKLFNLISRTFGREISKNNNKVICCNTKKAFFSYDKNDNYINWTCEDVCNALEFLIDNIFVRLGNDIYRQIVGIPMGTNCAPLIADLFLFCFEMEFMHKYREDNLIISAFNSTSRYLDDICNIDNDYFHNKISEIYPKELKLNKANTSNVEASFLDLNLSIHNGIIHSKIYDKRDDFNFKIVNYPNLSGNIPSSPSYGVYISQLIRFARTCSKAEDFHNRNLFITSKLLKQGYRYHKLRATFAKFYKRSEDSLTKYKCTLKSFLNKGISHPKFYGDIIYKIRKISKLTDFNVKCSSILKKYLNRGYKASTLKYTVYQLMGLNGFDNILKS